MALFEKIRATYVADGHHRSAAAAKICAVNAPRRYSTRARPACLARVRSGPVPASWGSESQVIVEGAKKTQTWIMNVYRIDYDFIETLELKILQGRSFSRQRGDGALSAADWEDAVHDALRMAVKRRMVADVPVGVLLSGILD